MDTPQNNEPLELSPSWLERFLSLPFCGYVIKNKGIVLALLLLVASSLIGLSFYLSKHQTSSIARMFKAQHLAKTLKSAEHSSINKKETLSKLEEIVATHPEAAVAFAGIVAEENLIQNTRPPDVFCFTTASQELKKHNFDVQCRINAVSLLYAQGKMEEALATLESATQDIEKCEISHPAPNAYAYLLLQKAIILKELQRSPNSALTDFERILAIHPDVNENFEQVFFGNVKELLSFLRET